MPSRDELLEEARRRGLDLTGIENAEASSQAPSRDELMQEAMRRGLINNQNDLGAPNNQEGLGGLENFYRASGIHGANRAFAKVFGFGPHQQNTQQAYEQSLQTHPLATRLGNIVGTVAAEAPAAVAFGAAPGASLLSNMLAAGKAGAATGLIETPYDDETRMGNVLRNALLNAGFTGVGGGIAKGVAALPATAKKTQELVKNIPKATSKAKIAQGIEKSFAQNKLKHSELYDSLFEEASARGASTGLKIPRELARSVNKTINKKLAGVDKTARDAVKKVFKTNDPAKLKEARTALYDFIKYEKKSAKPNRDAILSASEMRKELGAELSGALEKVGLGQKYKDINKSYAKEVIPYAQNPAIGKYTRGELTGGDFIKALQGGGKAGQLYRKNLVQLHPEVATNQYLNKLLSIGLKNAAAGAGIGAGYGIYKGLIE